MVPVFFFSWVFPSTQTHLRQNQLSKRPRKQALEAMQSVQDGSHDEVSFCLSKMMELGLPVWYKCRHVSGRVLDGDAPG